MSQVSTSRLRLHREPQQDVGTSLATDGSASAVLAGADKCLPKQRLAMGWGQYLLQPGSSGCAHTVLGREGKRGGELAVTLCRLAAGLEKGSQLVLQTGSDAATRDHPPLT